MDLHRHNFPPLAEWNNWENPFLAQNKFLLKRKYLFKIIKNIITQQFYDLTMNSWVGYSFLFPLLMGFGLWLCSCFSWVSSWPIAPKACVSCLCKISWVLLLVLTNKSCSSVKVFWDHMYLCQVWNNLPQGIPPWASGSGSSFWPSSCTSGSSSSFPWRSQASIFAMTVAAAVLWAQEADTKQEGTLQIWAHPLNLRQLPHETSHYPNRQRDGGHINVGILECCVTRKNFWLN